MKRFGPLLKSTIPLFGMLLCLSLSAKSNFHFIVDKNGRFKPMEFFPIKRDAKGSIIDSRLLLGDGLYKNYESEYDGTYRRYGQNDGLYNRKKTKQKPSSGLYRTVGGRNFSGITEVEFKKKNIMHRIRGLSCRWYSDSGGGSVLHTQRIKACPNCRPVICVGTANCEVTILNRRGVGQWYKLLRENANKTKINKELGKRRYQKKFDATFPSTVCKAVNIGTTSKPVLRCPKALDCLVHDGILAQYPWGDEYGEGEYTHKRKIDRRPRKSKRK